MKSVTDDQLILYYYGEAPDAEELGRQIEALPELQRRLETLRGILDSVEEPEIPERHPSYGSVVWLLYRLSYCQLPEKCSILELLRLCWRGCKNVSIHWDGSA